MIKHFKTKTLARKTKVRSKLRQVSQRLRLTVFRSCHFIYAQIIDDQQAKTLVAASEKEIKEKGQPKAGQPRADKTKIERAAQVGQLLAQKAQKKKIKKVYFDRGAYKYHGRVKALVEGARKGGLEL